MRTTLQTTVTRQCFPDHAEEILAAVDEAEKRGHRFGPEKFTSMADDRRISWRCTRCGDLVIAIAQGKHPLEIAGCAHKLGRCPADLKGARDR